MVLQYIPTMESGTYVDLRTLQVEALITIEEFNEIKEADIKILGNFPVEKTGWQNIEKLSITLICGI